MVDASDLLIYQVILRDRTAITDLVGALLTPLQRARGGAGPLLATLQEYYACGGVAAETARRLHLSVRAVTYRLARVRALTGRDPADPAQGLALRVAVIGARMLDWPAVPARRLRGRWPGSRRSWITGDWGQRRPVVIALWLVV